MADHNSDIGNWDNYWHRKSSVYDKIYHLISSFYRKIIFKPALNHFFYKYCGEGAKALHAGCGSGQVDSKIIKSNSILALDISLGALNIYKKGHGDHGNTLLGDILSMPLKDNAIDLVYNLGVMEHFTRDQIGLILKEFHRVLKKDGRVLLFWPPEFGLTVIGFKLLQFVFNKVLGIKRHNIIPEEITRIRSKRYANEIFEGTNFVMSEYYFGIRDMFTHCIIVLQKV